MGKKSLDTLLYFQFLNKTVPVRTIVVLSKGKVLKAVITPKGAYIRGPEMRITTISVAAPFNNTLFWKNTKKINSLLEIASLYLSSFKMVAAQFKVAEKVASLLFVNWLGYKVFSGYWTPKKWIWHSISKISKPLQNGGLQMVSMRRISPYYRQIFKVRIQLGIHTFYQEELTLESWEIKVWWSISFHWLLLSSPFWLFFLLWLQKVELFYHQLQCC